MKSGLVKRPGRGREIAVHCMVCNHVGMSRDTGGGMSAHNGDKSRHQINRKRVVLRRAKIRDLVKAAKERTPAPAKAEAK